MGVVCWNRWDNGRTAADKIGNFSQARPIILLNAALWEEATKTTTVTTYQDALDAMDGRAYTLDGVHGTIKVERFNGRTSISHNPSRRGQNTEAYQQVKRKLGDDWSTDLSQSERFGEIAHDLGIRFA